MVIYKKNGEQKELLIKCSCHNLAHMASFSYWENDWDVLYLTYTLVNLPWYERIWYGLKYIIGMRCDYFNEVVMQPEDVDELITFLNQYKNDNKEGKWNGKQES